MRKTKVILLLMYWIPLCVLAQYNTFYIGMGVFDFDNVKNLSSVPKNTDPEVGNDQAYLQILVDDGFNLILPYHQLMKNPAKYVDNQPSKGFLNRAESLGIKVILQCPETSFESYLNASKNADVEVKKAIDYYNPHPAVIGYSIADEPNINDFSAINKVAKSIKKYAPNKLRFVNLFPNYAPEKFLNPSKSNNNPNAATYQSYVMSFLQQCDVNFVSLDNYVTVREREYFQNLDLMVNAAKSNHSPYFCMIYIREKTGKIKSESIDQFRYSIYSNLLYGSKGVFYYSREGGYCCKSKDCNTCDIIAVNNWDNNVSEDIKKELRKIHSKLLNKGDLLFELELQNVYHYSGNSGVHAGHVESIPSKSEWSRLKLDSQFNTYFKKTNKIKCTQGDINNLSISFLKDRQGKDYIWVFNKDIQSEMNVRVKFRNNTNVVEVLDNEAQTQINTFEISLNKGEAKLYSLSL